MSLSLVLEGIVTGILTGGVYALMAAGLTLIFGVMDIINIAQGAFVILSAYLSYDLTQYFQIDLFLGLFITIPIMFIFGVILEWTLIRPLKRDRTQLSILVTYAIAIILEGVLTYYFTGNVKKLFAWYTTASVQVGGFYLPYIYLMTFVLSVVLLAALYMLLYHTQFGRSVRAMMQNRTAALLIGIDVERVAALTFGVGVALTAAGGMAYGATTAFNPNSHYDLISRLLVIIIFAGMGSVGGSVIASIFMLVTYDVTSVLWSPVWASTVFYLLLVIILFVRPQGLFGKISTRQQ
jgi:branched-chain amino acid transport system permease protein